MTIRVLVVDDQELVRAGFAALLNATPGIEVVAEAPDGAVAIERAAALTPDVILMDVRMPEVNGIDATRAIIAAALENEARPPRVLMLTTFDLDDYVYAALRAGASGFLLKDTPPVELINAVRVLHGGEALLAPAITRRLISEFAARPEPTWQVPAGLDQLTPREAEVLRLIGRGLTNAEIASELFVSEATVKTHVGNLMAKLHLSSRAQAVVVAYESGLVVPGSI